MKRLILIAVAALLLAVFLQPKTASAHRNWVDRWAARHAARTPWHAQYNHTMWGQPVALVVPPTARSQTHWGWGVTGTRTTPIYHQFGRSYSAYYQEEPGPLGATPRWPSDTSQFGVYYIRGPY